MMFKLSIHVDAFIQKELQLRVLIDVLFLLFTTLFVTNLTSVGVSGTIATTDALCSRDVNSLTLTATGGAAPFQYSV